MSKKYQSVYQELKKEILSGVYRDGEKLPAENTLTDRFGVSRQTIRQALDLLAGDNLIRKSRGSGTFVQQNGLHLNTKRVAVIAQTFTVSDFPLILSGMETVFSKHGYSTMLFATHDSVMRERQILTQLCEDPVDGILLCAIESQLGCANLDLMQRLQNMGTKLMFFAVRYPDRALEDVPSVTMDDYSGVYRIVRDLIDQGYRRIGVVSGYQSTHILERVQACRQAIIDADLQYDSRAFLSGANFEDLHRLIQTATPQALQDCDLIVCTSATYAQILVPAMQASGRFAAKALVLLDKVDCPPCEGVQILMYKGADETYGSICAEKLLRFIAGQPEESAFYPWEKL